MSFLSDAIRILSSSEGKESLTTETLRCHASCYRENLRSSSDAMLQYEWAWLHENLQRLRHWRHQPGEEPRAYDVLHLNTLISECVLFQLLLQEEFSRRGLRPRSTHPPVIPSEEAWEITSLQVKRDWGIVPD